MNKNYTLLNKIDDFESAVGEDFLGYFNDGVVFPLKEIVKSIKQKYGNRISEDEYIKLSEAKDIYEMMDILDPIIEDEHDPDEAEDPKEHYNNYFKSLDNDQQDLILQAIDDEPSYKEMRENK